MGAKEEQQKIPDLFDEFSFGGKEERGAMASVMMMQQLREQISGKDISLADVEERDIQPAFNSIDVGIMINKLGEYPRLIGNIEGFLRPRTFKMKVDDQEMGG